MGDLLGIKPIIEVTKEGSIGMAGRARGQKKALAELQKRYMGAEIDENYPVYFLQTDTDAPARALMSALEREGRIFRICCAVGAHIGPNAVGIVYVEKK